MVAVYFGPDFSGIFTLYAFLANRHFWDNVFCDWGGVGVSGALAEEKN